MNKMKRELTILLLALGSVFGATAQEVLMVTLDNANGTQIFHGIDAFKEAMAVADHGDMITLSEGTFNAADITKAVSIYGNGYEQITKEDGAIQYPTNLNGNFVINIDSVDGKPKGGLYMEGISNYYSINGSYKYYTINAINGLTDAEFVKCRFYNFRFWETTNGAHEDTKSENVTFRECRLYTLRPGDCCNMALFNSYIYELYGNFSTSSLYLENCIARHIASDVYATWRNCIMMACFAADTSDGMGFKEYSSTKLEYPRYSFGCLPSTSNIYNCIYGWHRGGYINSAYSMAYSVLILQNCHILDYYYAQNSSYNDDGFKSLFASGTYGIFESNILTEEAQTTYLGNDSTQVGLYGGTGFSMEPTIPRVIYKDIATKTENNKLKVNIKVDVRPTNE